MSIQCRRMYLFTIELFNYGVLHRSNKASPALRTVCFTCSLNLGGVGNATVNVEAEWIVVVHVAHLGRQELPVNPGQAGAVHILRVGRELGRRVESARVDAPFLQVDELSVGLVHPVAVACGPLAAVVSLSSGVAVN